MMLEDAAADAAIKVDLPFFVDTGKTPSYREDDSGVTSSGPVRELKPVIIANGRLTPTAFSLGVTGFTLSAAPTKVSDFYDDHQLKAVYDAEVETLVIAATGATKAVVFDHTRRSTASAMRDKYRAREPAMGGAHADYSDRSAAQRLRDVFGEAADEMLKRSFSIVNVWRSTDGIIERAPLALCDARTVDESVMHTTVRETLRSNEPSFEYGRVSETRQACYDPGQRWFYFPRMNRSEALIFKTYDTMRTGTARFCLHTAVELPDTPSDAAPRNSIESRVFVFYDE